MACLGFWESGEGDWRPGWREVPAGEGMAGVCGGGIWWGGSGLVVGLEGCGKLTHRTTSWRKVIVSICSKLYFVVVVWS